MTVCVCPGTCGTSPGHGVCVPGHVVPVPGHGVCVSRDMWYQSRGMVCVSRDMWYQSRGMVCVSRDIKWAVSAAALSHRGWVLSTQCISSEEALSHTAPV